MDLQTLCNYCLCTTGIIKCHVIRMEKDTLEDMNIFGTRQVLFYSILFCLRFFLSFLALAGIGKGLFDQIEKRIQVNIYCNENNN